jgi:hypothetical protein
MSDEPDLSTVQTTQTIEDDMPMDFLSAAVQTNQILSSQTIPGPDSPSWKTYWNATNPDAWSLVWDSFVTNKQSLYQYYQSGTSVPYTFNISSSIDSTAKSWGLTTMTSAQQQNAQTAIAALGSATGLTFTQSSSVTSGMVIAMCDLGSSTYGQHFFDTTSDGKTQYTLVLNSEFYGPNPKNPSAPVNPLNPGGTNSGYETLLHELGHAAGLDDAEGSGSDHLSTVNPSKDSTDYTIMSYTGDTTKTDYQILDKQALSIIYRQTTTQPVKPTLLLATLPQQGQNDLAIDPDDEEAINISNPGGGNQTAPEQGADENSDESQSPPVAAGAAASGVKTLASAGAVSLLGSGLIGANAYPAFPQKTMQQNPGAALFAQS